MNWGGLEPWLIPWASALLELAHFPLEVTSVVRGWTLQSRLFRRSQSGLHAFPVAPPDCDCATHMRGISWDMIGPLEELQRLGRIWQSWGGIWGGAADPIHFQAGPDRKSVV